jgi:8-amino-7-oxononanoate synthase
MSDRRDELRDLSAQEKRALLEKLLDKRQHASPPPASAGYQYPPEYTEFRRALEAGGENGVGDLLFRSFDGINRDVATSSGRIFINFCSYNYVGMSGDPEVSRVAIEAINTYGTSVSASRLVSGERPLHRQLEQGLAELIGAEDALVYVGGFSTNVDTIGHLFGKGDLIVYDSLIHASVQEGARLTGATAVPFPHNNMDALENILARRRKDARQALVVVEGVYSMDGDIADLPRLIEIKKAAGALLMIDEAHSVGVLGRTGRGIGEHFGTSATDVDLWMGTLSKTFASCGGYIAGARELIDYLRRTAPGFVFSVGMSPPNAAAALASLRLLVAQPERVSRLRENSRLFHRLAQEAGLDTGTASFLSAIAPVMIRNTRLSAMLSRALMAEGILALPIGFPAVPENAARLRFFINSSHSEEQIRQAVRTTSQCLARLLDRGQAK